MLKNLIFKSLSATKYYSHMNLFRPLYNYKPNRFFYKEKNGMYNLNEIEQKIISDLFSNSISVTHFNDLFPQHDFQYILDCAEKERLNPINLDKVRLAEKGIQEGRGKFYNVQFWSGLKQFDERNLFTDFMLQDSIIKIASSYLQTRCKLYYLDVWYNIPMQLGSGSILSQNWHRDPDDQNCVKVFLYLNDVDEDMGSLCYIPKSPYGKKYGNIFPRGPPNQESPNPEQVDAKFKHESITMTGKAGTIVFVDTTGLHKGGYSKTKARYVMNGCFYSNGSYFRYNKMHMDTINKFKNDTTLNSNLAKYAIC